MASVHDKMSEPEQALVAPDGFYTTGFREPIMSEHVNQSAHGEQLQVEYRAIEGFPGYRVGSDGSVWGRRKQNKHGPANFGEWKRLAPDVTKSGHLRVKLYPARKQFFVHRLVLEAFVGPCPQGMESCHDPDRDPTNNSVSNLRWDTRQENQNDTVKHGTKLQGSRKWNSKLKEADIPEIRRLIALGRTMQEVADLFGIHDSVVCGISQRKMWKHVI